MDSQTDPTPLISRLALSVVKDYELAGGIAPKALTAGVQAALVKEGLTAEAQTIQAVIFSMLAAETLRWHKASGRICLPEKALPKFSEKQEAFRRGTPQPDTSNPSGYYPIGAGDTLYNAAGEAVAVVESMQRNASAALLRDAQWEVTLRVTALFSEIWQGQGKTVADPLKADPAIPLAPRSYTLSAEAWHSLGPMLRRSVTATLNPSTGQYHLEPAEYEKLRAFGFLKGVWVNEI